MSEPRRQARRDHSRAASRSTSAAAAADTTSERRSARRSLRRSASSTAPRRCRRSTCGLGREFGVPQVTRPARDRPDLAQRLRRCLRRSRRRRSRGVDKLGEAAFFRNEPDEHGDPRVRQRRDPDSRRRRRRRRTHRARSTSSTLARLAADRLPDNPRLAPTRPARRARGLLTTRSPRRSARARRSTSSLADDDGSLMCSWAARPGRSLMTDPAFARAGSPSYRRLLDENLYTAVDGSRGRRGLDGVLAHRQGRRPARSSTGRALAVINVVPTAGFSDARRADDPRRDRTRQRRRRPPCSDPRRTALVRHASGRAAAALNVILTPSRRARRRRAACGCRAAAAAAPSCARPPA